MANSKVSIIIPNYNEEHFIAACLDSCLHQTYQNIEIIVVDDGSTDGSAAIADKYAESYPQISVYRQLNQNASIARNRGMEHASGDYYYFLDSDDFVYPDAIRVLVEKAEEYQADFVAGNVNEVNENGKILESPTIFERDELVTDFSQIAGTVWPGPSNKLFRASVVKEYGVIFGNVRIAQDVNFLLKFLACCKKMYTVTDVIYAWRSVQNSMSHDMSFRIFDITESFKNVRAFYKQHGFEQSYKEYITAIEYHHYYRQMEKQTSFPDRKARKLVVDFFSWHIKRIDLSEARNLEQFAHAIKVCRLKMVFSVIYRSGLYRALKKK